LLPHKPGTEVVAEFLTVKRNAILQGTLRPPAQHGDHQLKLAASTQKF
jgi:hypothetical protein